MSTQLLSKTFLITYDSGDEEKPQTLKVPDTVYEQSPEFRKNIITMKCLSCNFESNFDCIEKEQVN